ncbi:MAG: Ldh family oxidoreductase [Planctomycetota bacterium]|nr:MAG: Ldh family oxidoreductase [Planctomycetota bacterium]REK24336.1 MAG: Ldh family oxidoreductase [Planctomycetota bacterium]REK38527.1 MAG: Ldh family oxidoreductase [Planctomycetota bacterium]
MLADPNALKAMTGRIFSAIGCADAEARCIADHLVEANLAGHDSHGVIRVTPYLEWFRAKKVFAGRTLEVVCETDTLTVADGGLGFGQWIGKQAVDIGISKCRTQGCAIFALRNSGHLGRIGHWAEMAAEAGLVSLHFVNTSGLGMHVVPAGGKDRRLSVNPVTAGVPIEGARPVILDIAAAATAEGKLKVARNQGIPVPDGWIVDVDGNPTNDPNVFYGPPQGAILPLGGHKGYGLGLVADLLAGALSGGGCSDEGKDRLEQSMFSVYVDPLRLQSADAFFGEVRRYVDFVKSSRPLVPGGEVLVPGEVEDRARAARGTGLELDEATWGQLVEAARTCEVAEEVVEAVVKTS